MREGYTAFVNREGILKMSQGILNFLISVTLFLPIIMIGVVLSRVKQLTLVLGVTTVFAFVSAIFGIIFFGMSFGDSIVHALGF